MSPGPDLRGYLGIRYQESVSLELFVFSLKQEMVKFQTDFARTAASLVPRGRCLLAVCPRTTPSVVANARSGLQPHELSSSLLHLLLLSRFLSERDLSYIGAMHFNSFLSCTSSFFFLFFLTDRQIVYSPSLTTKRVSREAVSMQT